MPDVPEKQTEMPENGEKAGREKKNLTKRSFFVGWKGAVVYSKIEEKGKGAEIWRTI